MNQQTVDIIENGLRAMSGTETAFRRLSDAGPSSPIVIADFRERLSRLPRKEWQAAIVKQARERAHEICSFFKPGDLFDRDPEYFWDFASNEMYDAMRPLFASSRPVWPRMTIARGSYIGEVKLIQDNLFGPLEARAAMTRAEIGALEREPTMGDWVWKCAGRGEAWALKELIDDWLKGRERDGLEPSNYLLMVSAAAAKREDWRKVEGEDDAEAFQPMAHSPIRTHRALLEWYLSSHNAEALEVFSCLDDDN